MLVAIYIRVSTEEQAEDGYSLAAQERICRAFAESRGWRFKMLSDRDMDFSRDMGFAYDKEGKTFAMPGYSTFHKEPDGSIKRVGYDEFGPTDMYSSTWHFLELLEEGENGWEPQYAYEN